MSEDSSLAPLLSDAGGLCTPLTTMFQLDVVNDSTIKNQLLSPNIAEVTGLALRCGW